MISDIPPHLPQLEAGSLKDTSYNGPANKIKTQVKRHKLQM